MWPAYPITPTGSKGLKEMDRVTWQGICSQSRSTPPSPSSQFAIACPKGKVHLSPCPRSPGLKMDRSRPYQQQQVLLVCFLLKTLQGPEQSLPMQKASHDTTAGPELCSGQPGLPALWERPFEPTKGLRAGGQGIRPALVCLGDTLTLWGSSHQPRYLSGAGDGHPGGSP